MTEWFDPEVPRTFVAISSLMGLMASPGATPYSASKAALSSAFECFDMNFGSRGHRFIPVHPGPVDTAMLQTDRPLPWTWRAGDAARHIVDRVLAGDVQIDLCRPYTWLAKTVRILPASVRRAILRRRR